MIMKEEEYKKNIRKKAEIELLIEDVLGNLRRDIDKEKEKIKEEKDKINFN